MTIEEYGKLDSDFNRSKFIGDMNRMIQNIYFAISSNHLESIHNYVSDKVYQKIKDRVARMQKEEMLLKYDHVFVDSDIEEIRDDKTIQIVATCSYSKYYVLDGKVVEGSDTDKIEAIHHFSVSKNDRDVSYYSCNGCGVSYDIRKDKKCPHCGTYNQYDYYDYCIVDMEK